MQNWHVLYSFFGAVKFSPFALEEVFFYFSRQPRDFTVLHNDPLLFGIIVRDFGLELGTPASACSGATNQPYTFMLYPSTCTVV